MKVNPNLMCPYCYKKLDGMKKIGKEDCAPTKGDYSICMYCEGYLEYQETKFNKINLSDIENLAIRGQLSEFKRVIQKFKRDRLGMH
jgi:hypothetical protein